MFHYSSYWRSWSRVLSSNHPAGPFIEVNLTVPTHSVSAWQTDVAPIRIRAHRTHRSDTDKLTDKLPAEVIAKMVSQLGGELTDRLLHEDFLPNIDWDLYELHDNGGAEYEQIRKNSSNRQEKVGE